MQSIYTVHSGRVQVIRDIHSMQSMHITHIMPSMHGVYNVFSMYSMHTIKFVTPPQFSTAIKKSIHPQTTDIPDIISVNITVFYQYVLYCCTDDDTGGSKHVAFYWEYKIN
jgi:hypothetical protein